MDVTILSPESTRAELIEALGIICHEAKRSQTIIGTEDHPSPWDNLHNFIDDLLTLLGRTA